MPLRPEDLPTDPAHLTEMVLVFAAENATLRVTVRTLKDMIFGARSEKLAVVIAGQLPLDFADIEMPAAPPEPANDDRSDVASSLAGTRKNRNRNIGALPKHLPRCEEVIEPETTTCPCCAGKLHRIGEDVNEVLDVIPAIPRILRIIRPKYACRACEGAVVQAKARPRLIENGMASTALVAWIATAKFAWGSTLYRQVQILAGHGVHLDRSTLAVWMKRAAWWLKGLYELQLRTMHAHPRLRIVLVPAVVQRFPRPGERHGRDEPDVETGFDQAPRDGTVIVAGRLEGADHRLAIGSQRLDQAVVLGTRVENG